MGLLKTIGSKIKAGLDYLNYKVIGVPEGGTKLIPTSVADLKKSFTLGNVALALGVSAASAPVAAYAPQAAAKVATAAVPVAKSFIPKSVVGKVAVAAAAPVVVGALVNSPSARSAAASAPSSLYNLGSNIGGFIEEPSLESAGTIFKENPIAAGALAAAGIATVGLGAGSLIASVVNTAAVREGTEALREAGGSAASPGQLIKETSIPTDEGVPATSATTTIKTGKKRRRKVATAKETPSVNQSVRVIVANRSTSTGIRSERYLKEGIYA